MERHARNTREVVSKGEVVSGVVTAELVNYYVELVNYYERALVNYYVRDYFPWGQGRTEP